MISIRSTPLRAGGRRRGGVAGRAGATDPDVVGAGGDRYATAAAVAARPFSDTGQTVWLATDTEFPDALAGVAAAGVVGGPVLLVRPDALPPVTAEQLARLAPARIAVLGGTAAISDAVVEQISCCP